MEPLKSSIRNVMAHCARVPVVRDLVVGMHSAKLRHHPYMRRHPLDEQYGIETSGLIPAWLLRSGSTADAHANAYAGCQPSCLRRGLSILPRPERLSFVDLGCGKGRGLAIASEWPFRRILGIELAPSLVTIAKRNAGIMRRTHPERRAIEVVAGDATSAPMPAGDLALFLHHSFGPALVQRMVRRMVILCRQTDREIFLVYENPVHAELVEQTKQFTKLLEANVPCTPDERGFAPDDHDRISVWRTS